MSIDTTHPFYDANVEAWEKMARCYEGEEEIKSHTTLYLPATPGMLQDGYNNNNPSSPGNVSYNSYLMRARFPHLIEDAVHKLVGVMHRKPSTIRLPALLEPMREVATTKRETLDMLLREINEQQMIFGRIGLLADVANGRTTPHLVKYMAQSIINWDEFAGDFALDELQFVNVREVQQVRPRLGTDRFTWEQQEWVRVNELREDLVPGQIVYATEVFLDDASLTGEPIVPMLNGRTLDFLPWVFINANDLDPMPGNIPLEGLANLSLAIYRAEADYRQTLHMLSQDTLVIRGDLRDQELSADGMPNQKDVRIGAGAVLHIDEQGAAEFIGINRDGISEQRQALRDDYERGEAMGARLLEARRGQAESGDALKVRVAATSTSLLNIALTGAAGLEQSLQQCAAWIGANPSEVAVVPNKDFIESVGAPAELRDMLQAKALGAPLSYETIHAWCRKNDMTTLEYSDELMVIQRELEEGLAAALGTAADTETDEDPAATPGDPTEQ